MVYKFRMDLTADRLRELLDYNPETGLFTYRKIAGRGRPPAGKIAGSKRPDGYISIGVDRIQYLAHRLVWLHVHGVWPDEEVDHVNLDRSDNRFTNLRSDTHVQNNRNSPAHGAFKTPYGRFQAKIGNEGKQLYLGTYVSEEEARAAYVGATRQIFGEFSPHCQPAQAET